MSALQSKSSVAALMRVASWQDEPMELIKYDAAIAALAEAHAIDEVKAVRDKVDAVRLYARMARGTDLLRWSSEIKMRAEWRCGELLAEMEKAPGGQPYSSPSWRGRESAPPTLADLGISHNQSSQWR